MSWFRRIIRFFRKKEPVILRGATPGYSMKKIAIIIGHDKVRKGAYSSHLAQHEYEYYQPLRQFKIVTKDLVTETFDRDSGWTSLLSRLLDFEPDLTIECHFNSYNGKVSGCEGLYLKGDAHSKAIATQFCKSYTEKFGNFNRGAKGLVSTDRGRKNLIIVRQAAPVSILIEPFFGDSPKDPISFDEFQDWLRDFLYDLTSK